MANPTPNIHENDPIPFFHSSATLSTIYHVQA